MMRKRWMKLLPILRLTLVQAARAGLRKGRLKQLIDIPKNLPRKQSKTKGKLHIKNANKCILK